MKENLEKGTIVDVRNEDEYMQGHIPNALNIPISKVSVMIDEFRKMKKPIITYCRGGNRSAMVVSVLNNLGITDVINGGGLMDLSKHYQAISEN